jgi:hypothetical protein
MGVIFDFHKKKCIMFFDNILKRSSYKGSMKDD